MASLSDNLPAGVTADITWNGKTPSANLTLHIAWWAWPGIAIAYLRQVRAPWWAYALVPCYWLRALTHKPKEA
jgi:hypothetical protein